MQHAPKTFVHLHNHTEYSLLDGPSRIPAMVARAVELEMPAIGITDHGVMYGAIHFYKACRDAGIKPIVGCEVYVAPRSRLLREGRVDRDPSHLTLLAADHEGYVNLMRLCTVGQMEGMYYRPRIDKEILAERSKGLIALSGCLQGEVAGRISDNDLDGAREAITTYRDIFGKDRFLLEVQRHGIEKQDRVNEALVGLGKEFGLRLCATNDLHYVHRHDSEAHDVLLCLQTGARFNDPNRWRFSTQENYLKTPDEMAASFGDMPDALAATLDIACDCSVNGRARVIKYVSEKYGADRVAQIITFTTMASKAAIRDVGRVLEVPLRDTDRLAKLVPVWQGRSKSLEDTMKEVSEFREAYESFEDQKRLIDVARAVDGVTKNVATHAAGGFIFYEQL